MCVCVNEFQVKLFDTLLFLGNDLNTGYSLQSGYRVQSQNTDLWNRSASAARHYLQIDQTGSYQKRKWKSLVWQTDATHLVETFFYIYIYASVHIFSDLILKMNLQVSDLFLNYKQTHRGHPSMFNL